MAELDNNSYQDKVTSKKIAPLSTFLENVQSSFGAGKVGKRNNFDPYKGSDPKYIRIDDRKKLKLSNGVTIGAFEIDGDDGGGGEYNETLVIENNGKTITMTVVIN